METKYWKDKWASNDIQFHRDIPNAHLINFFSKLKPRRVAVPLCGKSLDMAWLRKHGHEVIGFELSELACEAFFQESKLPFQKTQLDDGELYKSDKISIWRGDIFKSPPSLWEAIESVYDRAALVALPLPMRKQYAEFLATRVKKDAQYLLITFEYHADKELGPPFSVPTNEVNELFGSDFQITKTFSGTSSELSRRTGKFSETEVTEHVFELIRR